MKQRTLLLGMALLLCLPAVAQQGNAPPGPATGNPQQGNAPKPARPDQSDTRSRISVETRLVIVPVTVKDKEGRLVGDLEKDEFHVFSDNVEQQILLFTSDPFPLSAVVVLDNDLSTKQAEQVKKSLTTISAGFGPNDEVALITYSEYPTTVADFSFDNDVLFTKLKRLDLGSHAQGGNSGPMAAGPVINGKQQPNGQQQSIGLGIPSLGNSRYQNNNDMDDALFAAGDMLKTRGRDRRKIIFLVSDGTDSRDNKHTFDETLRSLLFADVSVYSISVSRPLPIGNRWCNTAPARSVDSRTGRAETHFLQPSRRTSSGSIRTSPSRRAINTRLRSRRREQIAAWTFIRLKCASGARG
jgi:VWFA-related protein